MRYCIFFIFCFWIVCASGHKMQLYSPDGYIGMTVEYGDELSYSVSYHGKVIIGNSPLGFEFKDENRLQNDLILQNVPISELKNEFWEPIVKNKHEKISRIWNEMTFRFQERSGDCRKLDFIIRVYNDGVAFRYRLYGTRKIGDRELVRELTTFSLPDSSTAWVTEYGGKYTGGQEKEFIRTPLQELPTTLVAGLPFLIEIDKKNYVAISEANIDNYPAFFMGTAATDETGSVRLITKLSPLPGEDEEGVKARFASEIATPWRVIMIGDTPGKLIESEIIRGLNPPCTMEDTSWIKPGMCAWDHWWSGEVKMEMDVIKEYIDFAAVQGWPYMLIDWSWYGEHNKSEADVTKPAAQLNMPELLAYARSKNVRCWLWLHSSDANKNDAYKEAFALYEKWGIAGVKIDFMSRSDQDMVNWYKRIVVEAAKHKLLVNFHGAYHPDGFERTYPNLLTREGVLGEEYSKFSDRIVPKHNVTLAYTRMLAGPMDYTPGGFLNVTKENFKQQSPTLVENTRCAELSKFVIYESPLTVVSDHPSHILGQVGADFLKIVPTTWDDIRFLGGYPDEYVALAKCSNERWFIGAMNNEEERTIKIDTSFLPSGKYRLEYWADGKYASKKPMDVNRDAVIWTAGKPLTIKMAAGGGYVGVFVPFD